MDICGDIITCINDPESGVSDAILELIGSQNAGSLTESAQSYNTASLIADSNDECDYDILYGQVTQLVDYLDQQHTDVFEIIEVLTNTYEQIASIFGQQSGRTAQAIAVFYQTLTFIQNSIAENYAAQVTTAYKEALACEWFCLAIEQDCVITPTLLFDSMKARLDSSININDVINDSLNFLITGTWSGQQIADFMFFMNFAVRAQVGHWLGDFAWNDITWHLVAFSNDPDSDWSTLCECLTTECFDMSTFTVLDLVAGLEIGGIGNPPPSVLWELTKPTSPYIKEVILERVYSADITVESMKVDIRSGSTTSDEPNGYCGLIFTLFDEFDGVVASYNLTQTFPFESWDTNEQVMGDSGVRKVRCRAFRSTSFTITGNVYIDNLCITYSED